MLKEKENPEDYISKNPDSEKNTNLFFIIASIILSVVRSVSYFILCWIKQE